MHTQSHRLLSSHILLMLCSDLQNRPENRPVLKGHSEHGAVRAVHTHHAGSSVHDRLFHLSMCTLTSPLIAAASSQPPSHLCSHYRTSCQIIDVMVHLGAHQASCWAVLKVETPETSAKKTGSTQIPVSARQ